MTLGSDDRRVRIGVVLPTRETIMAGGTDPRPLIDLAVEADRAGLDSVWVGDSLFRSPRFEPLTVLSAVAARTERVTLGTAILIAGLRQPIALAHAVATLDRLAGGRVMLGLGAGWLEDEFKAAEVPFGERTGRLAETIRCCRALWKDGPTSFEGRYWRFEDVDLQPPPQQPGGPSILVGGAGPAALGIAGRLGDGWFPTSPTPAAFRDGWATVLERAAAATRAVADLTPAAYLTVNLDPEGGPAEIRRYAESYYGLPYDVMTQIQGYFVGPPAACVAWLREFVDAGVRHLVVRLGTGDPRTHLARLVDEVADDVRAL